MIARSLMAPLSRVRVQCHCVQGFAGEHEGKDTRNPPDSALFRARTSVGVHSLDLDPSFSCFFFPKSLPFVYPTHPGFHSPSGRGDNGEGREKSLCQGIWQWQAVRGHDPDQGMHLLSGRDTIVLAFQVALLCIEGPCHPKRPASARRDTVQGQVAGFLWGADERMPVVLRLRSFISHSILWTAI